MAKMAFHKFKNVWTQFYQNTHSSLKIICLNEKAPKKPTLQLKKIYLHIDVVFCWAFGLSGALWEQEGGTQGDPSFDASLCSSVGGV